MLTVTHTRIMLSATQLIMELAGAHVYTPTSFFSWPLSGLIVVISSDDIMHVCIMTLYNLHIADKSLGIFDTDISVCLSVCLSVCKWMESPIWQQAHFSRPYSTPTWIYSISACLSKLESLHKYIGITTELKKKYIIRQSKLHKEITFEVLQ